MNKLKKNRKKYRIFRFMTYNQINELFNKNNLFLSKKFNEYMYKTNIIKK